MNKPCTAAVSRLLMEEFSATRLPLCGESLQHGDTTVLLHVIAVAYFSLRAMELLHIPCDRRSLLRGALLHDYFLYDWHVPDDSHRLHGFHHPRTALNNAMADFELSKTEQDIILHHMFPLTLTPPRSREAVCICCTDKVCSLYETLCRNTYPSLRAISEVFAEINAEK